MKADLLVNYNEFWTRLSEDLRAPQRSVSLQTFALKRDAVGNQLTGAFVVSGTTNKRVLADSFTRVVLSDRFRYSPVNFFDEELRHEARETAAMMGELEGHGVEIRFTNPYGLSPRRLLSRNHKKLIVLDDRTAYIGGINFSGNNPPRPEKLSRI